MDAGAFTLVLERVDVYLTGSLISIHTDDSRGLETGEHGAGKS